MHRFFLPPEAIKDDHVTFNEAVARQMTQVLRLKPDTRVMVLDGLGKEYTVQLLTLSAHEAEGTIEAVTESQSEPATSLTLYLCLTQREKFEWMLQKCTEVGASCFVPVLSSRSLVQDVREVTNKYERWQRILQEAAEQSHRGRVPTLEAPLKLEEAVRQASTRNACKLIPWEEERSVSLREALRSEPAGEVILLIGPEGGFAASEVQTAQSGGFRAVTLGPRILRMETAAVVASALVLYELGEMEGRS